MGRSQETFSKREREKKKAKKRKDKLDKRDSKSDQESSGSGPEIDWSSAPINNTLTEKEHSEKNSTENNNQ